MTTSDMPTADQPTPAQAQAMQEMIFAAVVTSTRCYGGDNAEVVVW